MEIALGRSRRFAMQMDFTLKNTRTTGSEIKDFLEDKTLKLDRYFQGKLHAKWVISHEADEHVAHLHVTGQDMDYFGEARDHNLMSSIEEAVDRVEVQLKRHKEIVQNHHKT
jgi:ribosomal subunit interface protein